MGASTLVEGCSHVSFHTRQTVDIGTLVLNEQMDSYQVREDE
jgi:hypothetical protein